MCNGLLEAGAKLVSVYDPDPGKGEGISEAVSTGKCGGFRKRDS